jgi:hypothetical protein
METQAHRPQAFNSLLEQALLQVSAEFVAVAPVAFTQVLLVAQQVGVPPEAIERLLPPAAPEA